VLHTDASGWTRSHVEATPRTFERLRETAQGDLVYRVRRGGQGTSLKRRFRDDQLRGATIVARVKGTPGTTLAAALNERPLGGIELAAEEREVRWPVAAGTLVRGLNTVALEAGRPFELIDIDVMIEPGDRP
jgi:hypothetical protein